MLTYLVVMIAASLLGVTKIVYLSYVLAPEEFGSFIALFSISIFSATVLSFGLIESTLKTYPVLIKEKNISKVISNFMFITKNMAIKYIVVAILLLIIQGFIFNGYTRQDLLFSVLLGYLTSITLLLASIVRSIEKSKIQQKFFFFRSATTLSLVVFCTVYCEWSYLILAEALGLVISILYTYRLLKLEGFQLNFIGGEVEQVKHEGGVLYVAFLLSSGISQVDKMLIGQLSSSYQVGQYGFVMIIVQVFTLLFNIITQRIGPKLLVNGRKGIALFNQFKSVLIWFSAATTLSVIAFMTYFVLKDFTVFSSLLQRYSITDSIILYVLIIGLCQVYVLLDFLLIAYDREGDVLVASIAAVSVFVIGFVAGWYAGITLVMCILIMLFSRLTQVVLQLMFLVKAHKRSFFHAAV